MNTQLEMFLETDELDLLPNAIARMSEISIEDDEALAGIILKWRDKQAIANLLMYPAIIPEEHREQAIWRALHDNETDYFQLAAVVGLQNSTADAFSHEARGGVAGRLISMLQERHDVVAARVSVTIADFIPYLDLVDLFVFLEHPNEVVRHNILTLLIEEMGTAAVRNTILHKVSAGELSSETESQLQQHSIGAEVDYDGTLENAGDPSAPFSGLSLLSYIPNLDEWN